MVQKRLEEFLFMWKHRMVKKAGLNHQNQQGKNHLKKLCMQDNMVLVKGKMSVK